MDEILQSIDDGLLTLTINRLAKKNSITSEMYTALSERLVSAQNDPQVRVVLIRGHDDVFSAGNDLADFVKAAPDEKEGPVWKFVYTISQFPKPIVAAVSGLAVGIGTTLLLHCDLVFASTSAKFMLPFVNLGLSPEAGSSLLLARLAGHQRASAYLMLGDAFSADEAKSFGFVNQIVAPAEVNDFALKQARRLLEKPQRSLIETKRLLKSTDSVQVQKQIEAEIKTFTELLSGPDVKEAVAAFAEKRKPNFKPNFE